MSTHRLKNTRRGLKSALAVAVTLAGAAGVLGVSAAPAFAAIEVPVTEAVSGQTATTATLHGQLNPGAGTEQVAYHFAYTPGAGALCTESGQVAPGEPFPEASGNHKKVSEPVTGLQPSEEYSYCLVASNGGGETAQGNEVTFTTAASAPSILAESVASRTRNAASFAATINPNNQETTYWFEYSTSPSLAGATTVGESTLSGYGENGVSGETGETLVSGTTYYYRVVAENATGKEEGAIGHFNAAIPPEAPTGLGFANVTATTAELEGVLNPSKAGEAGSYEFHYKAFSLASSPTEECNEASTPEPAGATTGAKEEKVTATASNLQPNARYVFCLTARNKAGEEVTAGAPYIGNVLSTFQTSTAPPKIDEQGQHSITTNGLLLQAKVNANNEETTYRFEYSTSKATVENSEGTIVKGAKPLTGTYGDQEASVTIGSVLEPNTTYYYRVIAENEQSAGEGTPAEGPVEELTTPPEPLVSTGQAEAVTQTTAALTGTITPQGAPTTYYYQYITQVLYETTLTQGDTEEKQDPYLNSTQTPARTAAENTEPQTAGPIAINGLLPNTTYYYRLVAQTPFTTTTATPQTLTTPPTPPTTPPPAPPNPPALPGQAPAITTPPSPPALTSTPIPFTTSTETVTIHEEPTKLTTNQKLHKALTKCHKDHNKTRRHKCEQTTKRRYKTKKISG